MMSLASRMETRTTDKRLLYDFLCIPFDETEPELLGEWKECSTYSVQGILLCDDYFCLFRKGNGKCYVFNRRFNVKRRKDLFCSKNEELELLQGNVQKKIGILLCTPEFGTSLSEADMMGVLFEEPLNDGKISKRLREIRLSDLERGNMEPTGAVFIYLA